MLLKEPFFAVKFLFYSLLKYKLKKEKIQEQRKTKQDIKKKKEKMGGTHTHRLSRLVEYQ